MNSSKRPVVLSDEEILRHAVAHLFARKAQEVTRLDLRGLSSVADWFVLACAQSEPQLHSILAGVQRGLRARGVPAVRSEYGPKARWGILDYGSVLIHVFLKEARTYYNLERLWADAPREELKAEDYPLDEAEKSTAPDAA